jgi:RimJ/RimL family protein N-acetyltransferase
VIGTWIWHVSHFRTIHWRLCRLLRGVVRAPDRDFDELIYVIHQKFWGKGYATEVGQKMLAYTFENSTLRSISATIDPNNQDSKKVAAKLGWWKQHSPTTP